MSIKLILCPFRGDIRQLNTLVSAFQIASALQAKVRVLHVATPAPVYPYVIGMGALAQASAGLDITVEALDAAERELIAQSKQYVHRYGEEAALTVSVADGDIEEAREADVLFQARVGALADCLPVESRSCDLILMGFDNRPDGNLTDVIAALSHGRRPVLLVPQSPGAVVATTGRPKTIVIAWDGSAACAQAVHDAMPFLVMATDVFVLRIGEPGDEDKHKAADLEIYLKAHGLAPEFVHIPHEGGSIGENLLHQANRFDARLIVMGAYGHGHLTEMVLGGATDHVLKHSHLPVLMAR